tara:strand:+ start:2711 stop:2926 length:216 start_codon:yes stop_codon:yes gene_type:complete
VHNLYPSGIVRIEVQTSPSPYVDWRFTARRQAHTGFIAHLVIQDVAFHAIHAWAGVVGQADFALWSVAIGD